MRRKPLRAVMLAAVLFVAVGALLYGSPLWPLPLANRATGAGAMLAAIRQWIRSAMAHITPAQLVGGVAVAWFFVVLALVLLARSGRDELPGAESPPDEYDLQHSSTVTLDDATSARDAPPHRSSVSAQVPRLSSLSSFPTLPSVHLLPLEAPDAAADNISTDTVAVSQWSGNPPVGSIAVQLPANYRNAEGKHPAESPGLVRPLGTEQKNGHLLALTGVASTSLRLLPYGLFLVAEDVGATSGSGEASRQIVDLIATQVAPSLANDAALESEHHATLFKMAVLRASMALRYQGIRTAADLGAVVAGTMIIGQDVYVINVGHCRTYLFRPGAGLLQIGIDHSVIARLVAAGLLPPEALDQHPRRDQIYRSVGGHQAVSDVDTFALHVQRDDQLVLCSPGLWQRLSAMEIEAIARIDTDPRSTAERLARAASRHGGDTVNVIVVRPQGAWTPGFGIPAT
ncbi:MAG: PP2C family protein-serine/threonine phosphatase [Ktedonobacterales bacterium]